MSKQAEMASLDKEVERDEMAADAYAREADEALAAQTALRDGTEEAASMEGKRPAMYIFMFVHAATMAGLLPGAREGQRICRRLVCQSPRVSLCSPHD